MPKTFLVRKKSSGDEVSKVDGDNMERIDNCVLGNDSNRAIRKDTNAVKAGTELHTFVMEMLLAIVKNTSRLMMRRYIYTGIK